MAPVYNTGLCKSCVYFQRNPFLGGGECHRYPKAHTVGETHWCGEQNEIPEPDPIPVRPEKLAFIVESKPKRGRPKKYVPADQG